jgi:hypothetical protein
MNRKKPVYDLTLEDLSCSPVWEFTHGEEDEEEGQDEATVRPVDQLVSLDSQEVMCVAATRFALADGTVMHGFLSPGALQDTHLGRLQPTIITDRGQISFWFGIVQPTQEIMADAYSAMGRRPEHVFPISFSLAVSRSSPLNGNIPGFLHLEGPNFEVIRVSS